MRRTSRVSGILLAAGLIAGVAGTLNVGAQTLLFEDTFNRGVTTNDLNYASTNGMSGSLGVLTYASTNRGPRLEINSGQLRVQGKNSPATDGQLIWIDDHNFVDSEITTDGYLSISVDIASYATGGSTRWLALGIGQALADLQAQTEIGTNPESSTADLVVGYRGTLDRIEIYKNGVLDEPGDSMTVAVPALDPSQLPQTMRVVCKIPDFNAATEVEYDVFMGGVKYITGTFNWSGTAENYISLSGNTSQNSNFDNLRIESQIGDVNGVPSAPIGLVTTGTVDSIELSWTTNSEPDVAIYKVYRGDSAATATNLIATTEDASYINSALAPAETWWYAISAVDTFGNESALSSAISGMTEELSSSVLYFETFAGLTAQVGDYGGFTAYKDDGTDYTTSTRDPVRVNIANNNYYIFIASGAANTGDSYALISGAGSIDPAAYANNLTLSFNSFSTDDGTANPEMGWRFVATVGSTVYASDFFPISTSSSNKSVIVSDAVWHVWSGQTSLTNGFDIANIDAGAATTLAAGTISDIGVLAIDGAAGNDRLRFEDFTISGTAADADPGSQTLTIELAGANVLVGTASTTMNSGSVYTLQGSKSLSITDWVDLASTTGVSSATWEVPATNDVHFFRLLGE